MFACPVIKQENHEVLNKINMFTDLIKIKKPDAQQTIKN